MNKWQNDVAQFFEAHGIEIGTSPAFKDNRLRKALILEEAKEVADAIDEEDFLGAIDGLADLVYVALGAAVAWGLDLEPFWDEVHRCNMRKVGGPVDPDTGKQLKPVGWEPPQHAPLLQFQRDSYEALDPSSEALTGHRPTFREAALFNCILRVDRFLHDRLDKEELAKGLRRVWSEYAKETLGNKAPAAFTKDWEQCGQWTQEANRRAANYMIRAFGEALLKQEIGEYVETVSASRKVEN